jgi:hypothetical protein
MVCIQECCPGVERKCINLGVTFYFNYLKTLYKLQKNKPFLFFDMCSTLNLICLGVLEQDHSLLVVGTKSCSLHRHNSED